MSQPQSAATFVPVAEFAGEKQREEFRAKHGVKLVEGDNDGQGLHRLPKGLYGHTYSPGVEDTPLFAKRGLRTFEIHKTASGDVVYLGFVTTADLAKVAGEGGPIKLFPGLEGDYQNIVAISAARVLRFKPATTRDDGGLQMILKAQ